MNKFYSRGASLIEGLIALAIVALFLFFTASAIISTILNSAGSTERRAFEAARHWMAQNNITATRMSCAHDSDGDGYGSCTVVPPGGEKIYLQCVAGFWQGFWGARGCKEVETTMKLQGGAIPR